MSWLTITDRRRAGPGTRAITDSTGSQLTERRQFHEDRERLTVDCLLLNVLAEHDPNTCGRDLETRISEAADRPAVPGMRH